MVARSAQHFRIAPEEESDRTAVRAPGAGVQNDGQQASADNLLSAEPPQQSRRVFLRLKSPPEGGIWGGVRLVNDTNGGDNTIGSKPTERKINKLHKRMNNKYSLPKDGGLISESAPRDIIHRYEKIHTKVYENEYEGVQYVADNIVKAIRMYNEIHCSNEVYEESQPFVLGLTTGRTPLGLYRELVKRHHEGQISFRNVAVYSLDEFYPIRSTEQQSRNYRIHEEFLNHIDILPENVHIPDGTVPEDRVSEYCASYDHSVRRIDLMIIGVGEDGQIGFNEPGSYSRSRTRLVQLTYNTRKIQSGAFFGLENTPKMAVTMGIDTIMRANRIILMAWGEEKAHIVQRVVEGEITDQVPASYLQAHQNIEVVIDENAAQLLTREQTPWMVGPCEWTPKFVRKAVVWLCGVVKKPILKLTYKDYIENSLGELLEQGRAYDQINDLSDELEDLEADLYEDDEDDEEPEEEEEDTEEDDNDDDEHRVLSKRYAEEVSAWFEREKPYLREDLRLTDLQRIFPISRSYLSQLFNRELGQSFSDYVNQFRIEESKRLMDAEPNASIQEIAERSGFHSISTFRRAFQKCTGMIPSEYKNNK